MAGTGKYGWLILLLLITAGGLHGQQDRKHIREGNRHFENERFGESEVSYRKALEEDSRSYRAGFNLGGALYKQEKFREAAEQFGEVPGEGASPADRSRFYHNLGNALLQEGDIENSIEAYKEALRNLPSDMETKYNLSQALRMLDEQQQNQQGQQNGQQDQQQQGGQQDQNEQQQPQDQQQQQQEQESDGTTGQEPRDRISREDAERLLQALTDDEKNIQEKVRKAQAKAAASVKVEKEW